MYDVGTKGGLSGFPILLMRNSKVIGLHKNSIINNITNEKTNFGLPIEIIINQISNIKCIYEINDYNYTQIINNTDGSEVNKEIESKRKLLNDGQKEKLIFKKIQLNSFECNLFYY